MKKRILNSILCFALAVLLVGSSCLLAGCSLFKRKSISFTVDSIELEVGDKYDLSEVIKTNTNLYTLSTPPNKVVKLSGKTLTALATGSATVTARAGATEATLSVTVADKEDDELYFTVSGELAQQVGHTSKVKFNPIASGVSARDALDWYVNEDLIASVSPSKAFSYTPTEQGEYVVTAKSKTLSMKEAVRVYKSAAVTVTASGELYQTEAPYSAVKLEASVQAVNGNPDAYAEWSVDGEVVKVGTDLKFEYVPTAGIHIVTVRVNGASADIDGSPSLTVTCEGSITPNAPTVLYDNVYPHIYVQYDAGGSACVEISSPDGTVTEYSQNKAEYKKYFGELGFDAGEFIKLFSSSSTQKAYRIRVKSLGDGGPLKESEYSQVAVLTMLPQAAEEYLLKKYFDRDYYITSESEYVNLFEYEAVFRPKYSTSSGIGVSFDCYMAYRVSDTEKLFLNAFHIGATSGSYENIVCQYSDQNVLKTSYTVDTVNNPTKKTSGSRESVYANQLHAILPHINYDETKYRADNYVFPIDKLENIESVEYSDELYLTAENNTRPVPKKGSVAETVYNLARGVLRKIVTDDMTDVQKAHAIYDWIMWQVTYDTPATKKEKDGESYSAYYLEGVFGDGSTKIGSVKYDPYAVCDGMSKAYSLLCNMEGIPCVRVAGSAGDTLKTAGGHAWNKVYLNGNWYIADCTWGDATAELSLNSVIKKESYELGLHDWLFVTDSIAQSTHFEPYDSGDSKVRYAPRTAATRLDVYSKMEYNGVTIDCSIGAGENQANRIREIVTAYMNAYTPMTKITVPGGPNNGVYDINYQGLEIYFDCDVTLTSTALISAMEQAAKSVRPNAEVKGYMYDGIALMLVK